MMCMYTYRAIQVLCNAMGVVGMGISADYGSEGSRSNVKSALRVGGCQISRKKRWPVFSLAERTRAVKVNGM